MLLTMAVFSAILCAAGQEFDSVRRLAPVDRADGIHEFPFSFDGYAGHWSRDEWSWFSARGLFLHSDPTARASVWAMEEEIGNQLLLEELWIERGFILELAARDFTVVEGSAIKSIEGGDAAGTQLIATLDREPFAAGLLAHLAPEIQFRRNRAFMVHNGKQDLFVLACPTQDELIRLKTHVMEAVELTRNYDFHRGLAGVGTNHLTITTGYQHNPFFLISLLRELGCTWIMASGYNDWMLAGPVREALQEIDDPFVWVSGQSVTGGVMFGIERYPDIQDNTVEQCLDWAAERGGYYFADLPAAGDENSGKYKGYILTGSGNQDRIVELAAPFVTHTGEINRGAPAFMVVLLEKGALLTQDSLMQGILGRRAVAVFPDGVVAGPPELRNAMQILLLEGAVLDSRFPGALALTARIEAGELTVDLRNRGAEPLHAGLTLRAGKDIRVLQDDAIDPIALAPGESRSLALPIEVLPESSDRNNLVEVVAASEAGQARALAHFNAPPAVTVHPLMFDTPGAIAYPISVWNPGDSGSIPVHVSVTRRDTGEQVIDLDRSIEAGQWEEGRDSVDLNLAAGDYLASVSALGVTDTGIIAIRPPEGAASTREEDFNEDGIPEIVMENDYVRVVVLRTGGRIIEYTLKENGKNMFFKLWPEKPPMHGKVGGTRQFYPFGGLEEFIGYPYIGGHIEYRYEILQSGGDRARVRVWANIHGSEISKIYTLYGGGPLLEARYEFSNMSPSLNVIGINPLFELGDSTGPEDRYYFPEEELAETRPELERYFGRATFPKQGWSAGYDTEAGISLVIGYPVDAAVYLHLWNNHPNNTPTPYYYTEIQPWIELNHGTTTYFTYYVLGSTEPWESLRDIFAGFGLMTESSKKAPWTY